MSEGGDDGGRGRDFIDWFALAYTVATAIAVIALVFATTCNADP